MYRSATSKERSLDALRGSECLAFFLRGLGDCELKGYANDITPLRTFSGNLFRLINTSLLTYFPPPRGYVSSKKIIIII